MRDDIGLHSDTKPEKPAALAATKAYLGGTHWEHQVVARWLQTLDPGMHQRFNARYRELRPELGILDVGDEGCYTNKALNINVIVDPHKDRNDVNDGFVATFPSWKPFTGGDAIYVELGMRFRQEAGDLTFAPAQRITHLNLPVESGERISHVLSMKGEIFEAPEQPFGCEQCDKRYTIKGSLTQHRKKKHLIDSKGNRVPKVRHFCVVLGCTDMPNGYGDQTTVKKHHNTKHPGVKAPKYFPKRVVGS